MLSRKRQVCCHLTTTGGNVESLVVIKVITLFERMTSAQVRPIAPSVTVADLFVFGDWCYCYYVCAISELKGAPFTGINSGRVFSTYDNLHFRPCSGACVDRG